eukprot:gnl/MRDRNA2_/MRDRNA2_125363_c0_seq1.p1 gnl/MRDRNA2_/MRDRNA2_125363_c0~~gnl/MRDRNA2_/MRDRNA2_125363_c0_seq1.p1  ORF type:complete len:346 (+),score=93.58 gnl/MRDRNA2_/MRDRNA2_125363_c0_seq1:63-1100(+)
MFILTTRLASTEPMLQEAVPRGLCSMRKAILLPSLLSSLAIVMLLPLVLVRYGNDKRNMMAESSSVSMFTQPVQGLRSMQPAKARPFVQWIKAPRWSMPVQPRFPVTLRSSTSGRPGKREDDDELDAMDTSDAWEDQIAEMRAWEASQKQQASAGQQQEVVPMPKSSADDQWDGEVDEGAWFDDEAEDEDPKERAARQLAEKQAAELLARIESTRGGSVSPSEAAQAVSPDRVMTSLESILNAIASLNQKVDAMDAKINAKLDRLSKAAPATSDGASAPSPPSAPSSDAKESGEEWDGQVDESAWFDEDADAAPLADWRDVRRAKKMLEAMENKDGGDEPQKKSV